MYVEMGGFVLLSLVVEKMSALYSHAIGSLLSVALE